MKIKFIAIAIFILLAAGCQQPHPPQTIDLSMNWCFSPDKKDRGMSEKWYAVDFDDSNWDTLNAGLRWEDQGYPDLDGTAWYRKSVLIPAAWKGKKVWMKFRAVNDAYTLFVNGESVATFGMSHHSYAGRPSVVDVTKQIEFGKPNLIAVKVVDWGNSGGLWRRPVLITTDRSQTKLFQPLSKKPFDPEKAGYRLFWEDTFDGDRLDTTKWEVRGVGPRAMGYVTPEAVEVKNGFLNLYALLENDSLKVGAVGTQGRFETTFGYFECRAKLPKTTGNWAAFWIQSPKISQGEDPAKFGTEIDIFEYFRNQGKDFVSHNLHWAYGPHQKTSGSFLSKVPGLDKGFHTFAVEWTPEKYAFFVDGIKYHEVKQAISHIDEYIILSFEPARSKEDLDGATYPDVFTIDYVKVYKKKN
ncbi:MAG: family 16 glycosylhydrolase [Calditrichaeota bacterium]|nr:family 16 glycosylhydrolase [Calditrichota bacterium]